MRRLAALVLIGCLGFVAGCKKEKAKAGTAVAAVEREARQAPGAVIAPPPLVADAGTPPLSGTEGVDADGYPTKFVDSAAIRGMLHRKEFVELTKLFTELQRDFEADPKRELWMNDASFTFDSAEAALDPLLDAWVAATPSSFAPYLARATHRRASGFVRRGSKWIKDTPDSDVAAMRTAFDRAMTDIDKVIALQPKVVPAHVMKISIGRAIGDDTLSERGLDGALAACPSCFGPRVVYLDYSTPRWGGSYEKMAKRASSWVSAGPKMKLLPALIDLDKADALEREKNNDAASEALERACAYGEYWRSLRARGAFQSRHGDKTKGLADLDRALELRPKFSPILVDRAYAFHYLKRYEEAGRDLRDVFMVDPTEERAKWLLTKVVPGLVYEGDQHRLGGRRTEAIRAFDLALELDPTNTDASHRRSWTIFGDAGTADDIAALEAIVQRDPNDFDTRRQLDYALAKQRKFDRVVTMWTEYLATHPEDGRAYLERGGALWNLGKRVEAKADAAKACERGVSEGCARAK